MHRPLTTLLFVLALSATSLACQKIEEPYGGEIDVSTIPLSDTIPADFGKLVGTTIEGEWTRLVFERADGAIVIVAVNINREFISDRVFIIPRE
jgi:hypothetical protein